MSESLRQIKNRIRSIENTKKLTRAMEMVAAAKLKPLENQLRAARRYSLKIESLLYNLLAQGMSLKHPFLEEREEKQRLTLCLVTSDTGLCGSYNHTIIRAAENFLSGQKIDKVNLVAIGKKGYNYFKKRNFTIASAYTDFRGRYSDEALEKIIECLTGMFLNGQTDEIYIAYTRFESSSRQTPVLEKFLNIQPKAGTSIEYLVEPARKAVVEDLITAHSNAKIRNILLDSFISEHSSRVMAMGEATDNAKELLEELILFRNKVRQASITRDIMEIVSAAEALKG